MRKLWILVSLQQLWDPQKRRKYQSPPSLHFPSCEMGTTLPHSHSRWAWVGQAPVQQMPCARLCATHITGPKALSSECSQTTIFISQAGKLRFREPSINFPKSDFYRPCSLCLSSQCLSLFLCPSVSLTHTHPLESEISVPSLSHISLVPSIWEVQSCSGLQESLQPRLSSLGGVLKPPLTPESILFYPLIYPRDHAILSHTAAVL